MKKAYFVDVIVTLLFGLVVAGQMVLGMPYNILFSM